MGEQGGRRRNVGRERRRRGRRWWRVRKRVGRGRVGRRRDRRSGRRRGRQRCDRRGELGRMRMPCGRDGVGRRGDSCALRSRRGDRRCRTSVQDEGSIAELGGRRRCQIVGRLGKWPLRSVRLTGLTCPPSRSGDEGLRTGDEPRSGGWHAQCCMAFHAVRFDARGLLVFLVVLRFIPLLRNHLRARFHVGSRTRADDDVERSVRHRLRGVRPSAASHPSGGAATRARTPTMQGRTPTRTASQTARSTSRTAKRTSTTSSKSASRTRARATA